MHISTRLILGGSQENTVLSCEGQADRGHQVSLVFGPIYGPEGSLLERVQKHGGIQLIETPNLVREVNPFKDWRCLGDLRRLIREWKPDVVHTHSSKAGILGRLAAWKERVPCVIHTIHGPPFHAYEKKWRNAMYILSERVAAKRCHVIACVADAMRDQFLAAKIGRREQYVTVYSGMEVDSFEKASQFRDSVRRALGLKDSDFVAGTIARLAENKGHDDLLNALEPVMKERPQLKLLWVGDGWWRERLMDRVKSMGLSDRIITTGLVPPEQIPKYLGAMDLLIHPSYREGLPRTVTQGLLAGLAVVAYDVDGTREVCVDHVTGRLIAPGNLSELRDAVVWMMVHPRARAGMVRQGQQMCRERFDAGRMVDHLDSIYAACLERRQHMPHSPGAAAFNESVQS
ncbi:MAG: glycosyltransferase family 4 protein [Phycisphaerales bacterium]|nr:glycosyltransferase family 4 protein [Phycisphaerales bacterium]MCI0630377.1 glycosyltransferase family 4 protein [Phycisphaerales bacterium]MCI0676637.1 glycosyltransferase family 4 protein [Phycisphaerales bacterium]